MDDDELLALIQGPESEQVERKERLRSKKDEVCQAICAFANDLGKSGRAGVVAGLCSGSASESRSRGIEFLRTVILPWSSRHRSPLWPPL